MDCRWQRSAHFKLIGISSMKDWNDAYKAGVDIRAVADAAPLYKADNVIPLHPQSGPQLLTRCAAEIEPEAIDWIWDGRIARGKLTVIGGDPEEGKSQIGVYIAATISNGGAWPNNEGRAPRGSVIILSAEDGAEDTLVPRLIAAGADRRKIHLLEAVSEADKKGRRAFNLQTDLQLLEAKIKELGDVIAVEIDPASAYMGRNVDSHNDQSVRTVLAPLAEMANRLGIAVISIMHFNKGSGQVGTKVMHRFMASIAFVAAARVAFAAVRDPEDEKRHLLLHAKNNLAEPAPGLAYTIEQNHVTEMRIKTSHIVWGEGSVSITAAQAMAAGQSKDIAPALEEAKQFLAGLIGCDGRPVKEIEKEAKDAGMAWATMRRAKEALKLKSERDGYGGPWLWKRP
jgi:putative DNA primase/helicase